MRITPSMQNRNFLENIDDAKARVDKAQREISSGKRVNQLSDDPFAASQASRIASVMSVNDQLIANNDLLRSKLELTDSVLQSLNETIDDAKSIAVQALSGSTTPESRSALAAAMEGARAKALSTASAQFDGTFIFSGTLISTEPFQDSGGTVTFHGNDEPLFMRLDRTTVIKTNITNADLFAGPPSVFGVLDSLPAAIEANDTSAIRAGLSDLELIANRINTSAAVIGSDIQLVDKVQSALKSHNLALQSESSRLTDADLVESISSLNLSNEAVSVTLQAQSRVQQLSLIDFLH